MSETVRTLVHVGACWGVLCEVYWLAGVDSIGDVTSTTSSSSGGESVQLTGFSDPTCWKKVKEDDDDDVAASSYYMETGHRI